VATIAKLVFMLRKIISYILDLLQDYSQATGCEIHGYVLMTNHVHILLTPKEKESVGQLMKRLGQRYVQSI